MKEQLISFETAKLAKENGFASGGQHCYVQYHTDYVYDGDINHPESHNNGDIKIYHQYHNNHVDFDISNENFSTYEMPTQSLLQKWLREVHHIFLHVVTDNEKYDFHGWDMIHPISINEDIREIGGKPCRYNSWEEALEIGLQEGLKLIKQ